MDGVVAELIATMQAKCVLACDPLKAVHRSFRVVKEDPHKRFAMPIGGLAKNTGLIHVTELTNIIFGVNESEVTSSTCLKDPLSLDLMRLVRNARATIFDKLRVLDNATVRSYVCPLADARDETQGLVPIRAGPRLRDNGTMRDWRLQYFSNLDVETVLVASRVFCGEHVCG